MYDYIYGKLIEVDTQKTIIDVNNIGYKIFTPINALSALTEVLESKVMLYLSFIVKEDSQSLYGFLTKVERDIFEMLITVSGVGAKTALLLIGHLEVSNLHNAVTSADTRLISKVPGIGKKTAQRLIIELADKFKTFDQKQNIFSAGKSSTVSDAINALINLGYNALQAQKAVKSAINDCEKEPDLTNLITMALRKI